LPDAIAHVGALATDRVHSWRLYEIFMDFLEQIYAPRFPMNVAHGVLNSVIRRYRMQDLVYVFITVAFFAVSIAYVHFCERVK
jgi:hypothetical protein